MKITSTLEIISPAKASAWLARNPDNRRLRRSVAEAMAAAMARGEWQTTHQGIALSKDGDLLDGQHRLLAITLHGKPVPMMVTRGLDAGAFKVIDTGLKRTFEDTTRLEKRTAEVCRLLASLTWGSIVSADQVLQVAQAGFAQAHEELISHCATTKRVFTAAPVRAAAVTLVAAGHPSALVFGNYRDAVHARQDCAPAVFAFIRQVVDGKVSANGNGRDLLARSLKFLDPDHRNLTKIQIGDGDTDAAVAYVRSIVRGKVGAA